VSIVLKELTGHYSSRDYRSDPSEDKSQKPDTAKPTGAENDPHVVSDDDDDDFYECMWIANPIDDCPS